MKRQSRKRREEREGGRDRVQERKREEEKGGT